MKKRKKPARFLQERPLMLGAKAAPVFLSASVFLTKGHKTRDLGLDGAQKFVCSFWTLCEDKTINSLNVFS